MNPQIVHTTRSQRGQRPLGHTTVEKELAAQNVIDKIWTHKVAAGKMCCAESTIHKWVDQLRNDEFMFQNGGRPAFVTPEQKKELISVATGNSNCTVKPSKRQFVYAFTGHCPMSSLVVDSFQTTGVAPFDPSIIRDKCQYNWSAAQKVQFIAAVPALSKIFESNFELKENDFDNEGIPSNNTSRDALAVHRRRALLLHAPHVLKDLKRQANQGPNDEIQE